MEKKITVVSMAVSSILSSFVVGLHFLHALPNCGSPQNFSTELFHPESTLYDPTSTPSSGSGAAVHRSSALANYSHDVLSLVNQFYRRNGIPHKFSFCITSEGYSSRIYFGNFGRRPLEIDVIVGNFMIDSATPVTFIKHNLIKQLSKKILDGIGRNLNRVPVPEYLLPVINLCFDWRKPNATVLPVISFHLSNNAVISGKEAFVDLGNNLLCLFIASAKHSYGVQIFGGGVLRDHRLEIDLEEQVVNIQAGHSGRCQPL